MLDPEADGEKLFKSLRHLKHNKHQLVLFHLLDKEKEVDFNFGNSPKRFFDVETGAHIDAYSDQIKEGYKEAVTDYFRSIKLQCARYKIQYIPVDINDDFAHIMNTYLVERQKFS